MRLGSEDKISVTSKDSSKLYFFFSWVNHVVGSALKRDRDLGGSWKKDIFDVQALRELMTKQSFFQFQDKHGTLGFPRTGIDGSF